MVENLWIKEIVGKSIGRDRVICRFFLNLLFYCVKCFGGITVSYVSNHDAKRQFLSILWGDIAHHAFINVFICQCLRARWELHI